MDVAEVVWKALHRVWRRALSPSREVVPGQVKLKDQSERLGVVAALLTGTRYVIQPASGVGGVAGHSLILPAEMGVFGDEELNVEAYLYRVAWTQALRLTGFERAASGDDELLDALMTAVAVPQVREVLHREFPTTESWSAKFEPTVLAARPREWVERPGGLLEALIRQRLGDAAPLGDDAPAASVNWLQTASRTSADNAQALRDRCQVLLGSMVALSGRGRPPPGVVLWGTLLPAPNADAWDVEQTDGPAPRRKTDVRVVELDRTIRLERKKLGPREDRPLYHAFEKLETADEYGGQSSTPDPTGNVDDMKDAVSDLALGTVVRTREEPQNLVRADVIAEPNAFELAGRHVPSPQAYSYPEWNIATRSYRDDWCTVFERRCVVGDTKYDAPTDDVLGRERRHVDEIRGHLLRTLFRRQVSKRQNDGPEIDVEAVVERHADLMAGQTPSERLYLAPRKALRHVAVLVLVDTSWSTDAWIDGRRVLDIATSSLRIISRAFEGYLESEVAVAAFRSETRANVQFEIIKGFEDSWAHLRSVVPSLEPGGYTRIGAALRHGTRVLAAVNARTKLLILLSDGKPTDYDQYEGRYGVEDVRHAVREANQREIRTFGIAIEKEAKVHLGQMLGPSRYRILPQPTRLPDVMAEVFISLVAH